MDCTLVVSDLLLPLAADSELYRGIATPALETTLARGRTSFGPPCSMAAWLCSAFGVAKQNDSPLAPLLLAADGLDAGHDYWLLAEPVYLRVDRASLSLASAGVGELSLDEASALIGALNHHFADRGLSFIAVDPKRWYVRVDPAPNLITTPLADAAGHDINPHLPKGADAMYWHRVINEAQMVLHEHKVNVEREARGSVPVNSIWLSGGGIMPETGSWAYTTMWASDFTAQALAATASIEQRDLPANASIVLATAKHQSHHLIVNTMLSDAFNSGDLVAWRRQLELFERDWMAPLLNAVRTAKITTLNLVILDREHQITTSLTQALWWRIWRRIRPLADYMKLAHPQ